MTLLMNAAGWAKTVEHVNKLVKVPTLTHVVMGSFTLLPREGNTGGTNFAVASDGTSVNSLGLPNGGLPYLEKHGQEMMRTVREAGKTPVISIAGFAPSEYGHLAATAHGLNAIPELNVSCPNVHHDGKQGPIIAYDWALLQRTLECVREATDGQVWVKSSPYSNPIDRTKFVRLIKRFHNVTAVVAGNTFPNVSMYDSGGQALLGVAGNYAGMAGTALKWISLAHCRFYGQHLPHQMIIGAGGISTAQDMRDYLCVGCEGGQIGTAFFHGERFRVFEEVADAFEAYAL